MRPHARLVSRWGSGIAITLGTTGALIGDAAAPNTIAANGSFGVYLADAGTGNNTISGNLIGSSTPALANAAGGITLRSGTAGNSILSNTVIGHSNGPGIEIIGANNNSVRGNRVGMTAAGVVVANQAGVRVVGGATGNVIGGGDWSEDRLIPDAVRAWQSGAVLNIRNPHAIRPWQHVLEPLSAYLRLAECLWADPAKAGAYNFGPHTNDAATVGEVVALARQTYGRGEWASQADADAPHEAGWLALEVARARVSLGVEPRWALSDAVQRTMNWYRRFADGADARLLCEADIADFEGGR